MFFFSPCVFKHVCSLVALFASFFAEIQSRSASTFLNEKKFDHGLKTGVFRLL